MVSEKILAAPTLFNLNNKLLRARARIMVAVDGHLNGQAATSIPFTKLPTMFVKHQSHTSFLGTTIPVIAVACMIPWYSTLLLKLLLRKH
jgi:hypothetical protein